MSASLRIRCAVGLVAAACTMLSVLPRAVAGPVHGGSGVVTASGRVGMLQINGSGLASVLAFAGQPDAQTVTQRSRGHASYDALGYGCSSHHGAVVAPVGRATWCRTAFYVDVASNSLELFFTTSHNYRDSHGVTVGMSASEAARRTGHAIHHGCATAIPWGSGHSRIVIGLSHHRVALLALTSTLRDPRVLRCL